MNDFVFDGGIRIIYGADQLALVASEIGKLGTRVMVVPTRSFVSNGHYNELERALVDAGITLHRFDAGKKPLLSKVEEGAQSASMRKSTRS